MAKMKGKNLQVDLGQDRRTRKIFKGESAKNT